MSSHPGEFAMQDDDTILLLNRKTHDTGLKGRLAFVYQQLFDRDIIAYIRRDAEVLRIHNGGEEFHKAAEECLGNLQVRIILQFA